MKKQLLATIDLGSNSFRLLIAEVIDNNTIHPVDQMKETIRLASGLTSDNLLTTQAQEAAFIVLQRFCERLTGFHKNQVRVVATSTLRIATNATEFIERANHILGFNIEIISGVEEARLIYIGAINSLAHSQSKRLIIDIGGGSTELIIGDSDMPFVMESITIGCVSFTDRFFINNIYTNSKNNTDNNAANHDDKNNYELSEANFNQAILATRSKIQSMKYLFKPHKYLETFGTSGSVRAIYDMCCNDDNKINYHDLLKLKKQFIKCQNIKDLKIDNLKEDRQLVIAGGLAILIGIMQELKIDQLGIADGALREGVMYDLLGRKSNNDLRDNTVINLKKFFNTDMIQSNNVSQLAMQIYSVLMQTHKIDQESFKLFQWATQLYEMGLYISHNDYHKHGAYILENAELPGFSKPEKGLLAQLVKAHRGNLNKIINNLSNKNNISKIKIKLLYMVLAFRLSVIFNRSRQGFDFTLMQMIIIAKFSINIILNNDWLKSNTLIKYSLEEEIKEWQKYNLNICLIVT